MYNKPNNLITYNIRDDVADNSGVQYNVRDDDASNVNNVECT